MKHTTVALLFLLAALQNGAMAAPQIIGGGCGGCKYPTVIRSTTTITTSSLPPMGTTTDTSVSTSSIAAESTTVATDTSSISTATPSTSGTLNETSASVTASTSVSTAVTSSIASESTTVTESVSNAVTESTSTATASSTLNESSSSTEVTSSSASESTTVTTNVSSLASESTSTPTTSSSLNVPSSSVEVTSSSASESTTVTTNVSSSVSESTSTPATSSTLNEPSSSTEVTPSSASESTTVTTNVSSSVSESTATPTASSTLNEPSSSVEVTSSSASESTTVTTHVSSSVSESTSTPTTSNTLNETTLSATASTTVSAEVSSSSASQSTAVTTSASSSVTESASIPKTSSSLTATFSSTAASTSPTSVSAEVTSGTVSQSTTITTVVSSSLTESSDSLTTSGNLSETSLPPRTDLPSSVPTMPPSSSQQENPKTTTVPLPDAPLPTIISTNPLETQVGKFSNFQKTLTTSLNDEGTKLTVQVTSSGAGQGFRGDFNLETEGTPRAGASFYRRQNDTESSFTFRVGLLKLIELNTGANWNLTSSENVINFANLSSNYWSPIKIADVPNNKSVAIKSISTTFSMKDPNSSLLATKGSSLGLTEIISGDLSSNGNVTVNFDAYMVNDTVTLDNVTHTPKSLKYSLKISNFPFRHADSQLAIVKGIYFKKGDENEYSSAASSLAVGAGKGSFNWTNDITLDSVASVLSTDSSITFDDVADSNRQESVAHVVFRTNSTFSSLVWDPEVILNEDKLVESYNQTGGTKSGVEKLFSADSSLVLMTVVSIAMILLNSF